MVLAWCGENSIAKAYAGQSSGETEGAERDEAEGSEEAMSEIVGTFYFMLPGIAIALVVAFGLVISYRARRNSVPALVWIVIILLAALIGRLAKT